MTNPFTRMIWYSLQDAAGRLGIRLTAILGGPLDHPREPVPARRVYDLLDERNFDGVLLHTGALSYYSGPRSVDALVRDLGSLPVVSFGVLVEGVASVAVDQATAVKTLVRHLHDEHGHRRFALVTGPQEQIEARIRRAAFHEAMGELGVPADRVLEFPGDYTRRAGIDAVRAIAPQLLPGLALVCSNDEEALGAREECQAQGISVPGQLAIVGFDDQEMAAFGDPGITTVGLPLLKQAGDALELLVRRMDGLAGPDHLIMEAQVRFRSSCGCHPAPVSGTWKDKADLLADVMSTQVNVTQGFLEFAREWVSDFLTAFEHLLSTGNPSVLQVQWSRYYDRILPEQERGIPFRRLFAGLVALYGTHPGFEAASRENIMLAGASEAFKGIRIDKKIRDFFFLLHAVEVQLLQINDRRGLAAFPFGGLAGLGISGVAVVRFGAPPALLYFGTPWSGPSDPASFGTVEYPELLPAKLAPQDHPTHRIVVALTAERAYLGYVVFWIANLDTFVCDFLANQFSGAVQRIELLERIREQSESLRTSLDETKRMQEQLVETEKVASLGRLVAGVAHEINTPLGTGITGTSFLLDRLTDIQTQFASGTLGRGALEQFLSQGKEALDGVLRNLMKAGELIQAFKGLGLDHGQGEWKPVELRVLFGDLGVLYTGELAKRGVTLRCEIPSEAVLVYTQPSALVQVAGELLENAMEHAFPPGFSGSPQVLLQVEVSNGTLRLAVTDNGRGLEPEERRHIFDPLYTTRRPEGHAGLGLHLAFQLVTRTLGGRMTVASEPAAGSCFLCSIPLKLA
jgi:DNA-binding LacI/PurR family transcriptional regulator/signal transduction histidine kinase